MPIKQRLELTCLQCGKKHYKLGCQLGRGRGKYCSNECRFLALQNKTSVTCFYCKKEFYKYNCELDCEKSFCSLECYKNERRDNIKPDTYKKINAVHEHIIVAQNYLGRPLKKGEIVHHIDENKHNNSPSNLAVLPNQKFHAIVHFSKGAVDITSYKIIK